MTLSRSPQTKGPPASREMATKPKKGLKGSINDMLGDLLGDDDEIPVRSNRPSQPSGTSGGRPRGPSSRTSNKSLFEDDFFSKLAAEEGAATEGSDVSDADPQALLESLKDMDNMEADLLGIKKPGSGPGRTTAKSPEKTESSRNRVKPAGKLTEKELATRIEKKVLTTPPTIRQQYKKFSFENLDDPLAGLLSDEEEEAAKKLPPSGPKTSPERNTGSAKERETSLSSMPCHTTAPMPKKEELMFEDDADDLMSALGFGKSLKGDLKQERKGEEEEVRPARSKLDELLGRGTSAKLLERPATGEPKQFKLDKKYQKQPDKEDIWGDEDFTFGAYQPTLASTPEGRQSRRQSVRFSSENISELKTDQRSKPATPPTRSPLRSSKNGADWLGLKDEDFIDLDPLCPTKDSAKGISTAAPLNVPSSPSAAKQPSPASQPPSGTKPAAEEAAAKPAPTEEEDNWLSNALSRKKAQVQGKVNEESAGPSGPVVRDKDADPTSHPSQPDASGKGPQHPDASEDKPTRVEEPDYPIPRLTAPKHDLSLASESRRVASSGDTSSAGPVAASQGHQESLGPSMLTQVVASGASLQQAVLQQQLTQSEPLALSLLNTGDYEKRLVALQAQLRESVAGYQAELLSTQTHLAQLESQVRKLELERTQQKLLLESLQQRHQEDLELIENAHRSRVKMVEDSYRQREERLRQENEQLAARLLSQCQNAEQAKAELLAQHQRRLAELEQEKVQEVERLRELQRVSILEMCKDHEEQLQRLKRLKDQEIDAVTSATSHTRSLNGVIEQMEKFSSNLSDLSHKVEVTHQNTSQELEIGARQRDEQLRVLQDRLTQQQRDMEEERGRLQGVIAKMEARLGEQTRLLEQERWRATAEQSKVESLQRSLEEQRRVMTQQLAMEREELERAKSALLEEQKLVMQKCAAERQKLSTEWLELHTQQKLSKERTEREVDRALQIDSQREGTIMTLAKEQADLKIRASELRAKEEQLAREREQLEQERQELRLEKERVNTAALNIKQRAEEIDSMSKLSSQKYEEGERALLEARKVESEHQERLRIVQQQMERLKQQEQHLHQERLNLAHQRRQLEQLREKLPNSPVLLLPKPDLTPVMQLPRHNPGRIGIPEGTAGQGPSELYARLMLLKYTAERDRDFLEDEQFFLETLKKASYNTSSQTA
ncbi:PREDICTED: fas-binding factor 1 isoform X2 [Crocodylus porosus]|uniref:fas-binding factor 1 isoform X2 n=1 Tax=Crocodylus porosus TaxID=8502 RepID=UPI00093ADD69|nr:PREDICTED: fas-binding factor 1 isoform X2 [Crocodylus porosus]